MPNISTLSTGEQPQETTTAAAAPTEQQTAAAHPTGQQTPTNPSGQAAGPTLPTGLTVAQALDLSGKIVRLFHHHRMTHAISGGDDKHTSGGPVEAATAKKNPIFGKNPAGGANPAKTFDGESGNGLGKAVETAQEGSHGLDTETAITLVTKVAHLLLGGQEE
jgi:hypothetical protein